MIAIMCKAKLQRALVQGGLVVAKASAAPPEAHRRLGNWAATVADGALVVAMNERTYLTLVFRLLPLAEFRDRFVETLRQTLLDRGVSREVVDVECEPLGRAPFVRLRNPALSDALDFAELEAGAHAEYQEDGSIQDMLNTYPHHECGASCPAEAVALLFGVPRRLEPTKPLGSE